LYFREEIKEEGEKRRMEDGENLVLAKLIEARMKNKKFVKLEYSFTSAFKNRMFCIHNSVFEI
jgi:hypothetical protein